jgi:hypothetical protein
MLDLQNIELTSYLQTTFTGMCLFLISCTSSDPVDDSDY